MKGGVYRMLTLKAGFQENVIAGFQERMKAGKQD